jgi:signal transduction histidine kinase
VSRLEATRSPTAAPAVVASATEPGSGAHGRRPVTIIDRAIGVGIILTVAANLVYFGMLLLPGDPAATLVDIWLSDVAVGIPVVVAWMVAVRTGFASWEVLLAASAVTFNLAGNVYYGLASDSSGYLPSPSPADAGFLLYYPFMAAALVVTVIHQSRRVTRAVLLDVALASLGAASVLAVILDPILTDALGGKSAMVDLIAALNPLFDLILVAVVVGVAASPVLRVGPRAPFLVLGLLLFTGADIMYALLGHGGAYSAGTPLDAAWRVAIAFVAVWVVGVGRSPVAERPASGRAGILPLPAIAVIAGLVVLLIATQTRLPLLALVLAAVTIGLAAIPVMFRQANLARLLEAREQVVDRLVELDTAKSDMIATVNHEMRTPLTSISGYLELVLDEEGGPIPPAAKDMLRVAEKGATRLQGLVADMLMSTRLEAAGAPVVSSPLRVEELLGRVVEELHPLAASRDVELRVEDDAPAIVDGDEDQLERAFTNVVENAVKFTPATGSVRAVIGRGSLNGWPAVTISVIDTGIGIPAEELPSLFERFFRASNARKAAVPGSGLGLAIVRSIVQVHGGEVSAQSVVGEGTTMRITLPLSRTEAIATPDAI